MNITPRQHALLCWLAREDVSQYGECYGADLDALHALGFVRTTTNLHDPDEPDNQPDADWPPPSRFHAINLTQAARDFIREQKIDIWQRS